MPPPLPPLAPSPPELISHLRLPYRLCRLIVRYNAIVQSQHSCRVNAAAWLTVIFGASIGAVTVPNGQAGDNHRCLRRDMKDAAILLPLMARASAPALRC